MWFGPSVKRIKLTSIPGIERADTQLEQHARILEALGTVGLTPERLRTIGRAYWTSGALDSQHTDEGHAELFRALASAHRHAHALFGPNACTAFPTAADVVHGAAGQLRDNCTGTHETIRAIAIATDAATDAWFVATRQEFDWVDPDAPEVRRTDAMITLLVAVNDHGRRCASHRILGSADRPKAEFEQPLTQLDAVFVLVIERRVQALPPGGSCADAFPCDMEELDLAYNRFKSEVSERKKKDRSFRDNLRDRT